uniref:Tumor necrosis factor ligand superfamily member 6 n=1 Tax=Laticauda laticaudata TaxID=8630 RepID=A0A8C5S708_LATLA
MQQNQYCAYPQIFWTNNSALSSSDCNNCLPLPVPERKMHRQNQGDGTHLCFLVVFLLILLAIMGIGLAMFQIFHLQKKLQQVTSQFEVGGKYTRYILKLGKWFWKKKVKRSAHLTGKAIQQSHPLEWETTHGHAFLSGVQYKNRGLMIDETGLYFIYSKVFFRGQTCTSQPLNHMVFKRNPSYPDNQVLMENRKMNYCVTMHMWGKSSYMGALFNLSRQDSVYVSVSEPALVNSEESKTFFGLYML